MSAAPLLVGMFGGGTVGGGVYQLLQRLKGSSVLLRPIVIKTICVRSLDKPRDFEIDAAQTTFTTDPNAILGDASIDCIVEVMGGTGLAKTVVLDALKAGKSVVTANKALLAEHLEEVSAATKTSEKSLLAYEAAVCGGIPIIQLLQAAYAGDSIESVMGICNGTTNYMLCKMEQGADYGAVLKEAQDLGFAEADPTADVEGHDVRAKIALLAKLAYGQTIADVEAQIPCVGISSITSADFAYCQKHNCTIKLTGTAKRLATSDSTISVYVSPVMVPRSHPLATASGSGNFVAVTSQNMGTCTYSGPGAGRFPTANSVVADLVRVANDTAVTPAFPLQTTSLKLEGDYSADAFYVRLPGGVSLNSVVSAAEAAGVPIESLETVSGEVCVITGASHRAKVQAMCDKASSEGKPLFMPFLK